MTAPQNSDPQPLKQRYEERFRRENRSEGFAPSQQVFDLVTAMVDLADVKFSDWAATAAGPGPRISGEGLLITSSWIVTCKFSNILPDQMVGGNRNGDIEVQFVPVGALTQLSLKQYADTLEPLDKGKVTLLAGDLELANLPQQKVYKGGLEYISDLRKALERPRPAASQPGPSV